MGNTGRIEHLNDGLTTIYTRTFAGSPNELYRAWTESDAMQQWWGPADFQNIVRQLDPRAGGRMHVVTIEPDNGVEYHVHGEFRELNPPHSFVCQESLIEGDKKPVESLVTLTFHPLDDQTEMKMHVIFNSSEERRTMFEEMPDDGLDQMFDRLDQYLDSKLMTNKTGA